MGVFFKFINQEEMERMLRFENSGFSLDAKVKIQSWDRDGLEKLIRYCARGPLQAKIYAGMDPGLFIDYQNQVILVRRLFSLNP